MPLVDAMVLASVNQGVCAADLPHANLPYQSLLTAPIEPNPGCAPLP